MRIALITAFLGLAAGCAHQAVTTVYDGGKPPFAVGERHGDQIWFYNGHISVIDDDNHVRLPTFDDAVLVGDQLYISPPQPLWPVSPESIAAR